MDKETFVYETCYNCGIELNSVSDMRIDENDNYFCLKCDKNEKECMDYFTEAEKEADVYESLVEQYPSLLEILKK